jgi:hypothetical protein
MIDAIRALREAVENGGEVRFLAYKAFPDGYVCLMAAYDGSLDAALALMKAVLPGWRVGSIHQFESGRWYVKIYLPMGDDWPKWTPYPEHEAANDDAARALVICELKALEATASASQSPAHLGNQEDSQ